MPGSEDQPKPNRYQLYQILGVPKRIIWLNTPSIKLSDWIRHHHLPLPYAIAKKMTWLQAITHSIQKWENCWGILHFKREGSAVFAETVAGMITGDYIAFNGESCALCHKSRTGIVSQTDCTKCPLNKYTSGCSNHPDDPWGRFFYNNDPMPMIRALYHAYHDVVEKQQRRREQRVKARRFRAAQGGNA